MSRERKPSKLGSEFVSGDGREFLSALRAYSKGYQGQKQKEKVERIAPKQRQAEDLKETEASAKATKKVTSKSLNGFAGKEKMSNGKAKSAGAANQKLKVTASREPSDAVEPIELLRRAIEETHISKCKERSKTAKQRRLLPEGAADLPDLAAAVERGVKESTTLLLDWSDPQIKLVGNTCKVFWDGENEWFYARVLNYDSFYRKHYVSIE